MPTLGALGRFVREFGEWKYGDPGNQVKTNAETLRSIHGLRRQSRQQNIIPQRGSALKRPMCRPLLPIGSREVRGAGLTPVTGQNALLPTGKDGDAIADPELGRSVFGSCR